jgi:hypothetical protein
MEQSTQSALNVHASVSLSVSPSSEWELFNSENHETVKFKILMSFTLQSGMRCL